MTENIPTEELEEIAARLVTYFDPNHRLVFWEDEEGDYGDIAADITIDDACVIDVTHRELASKRRILRDEQETRFVIYRQGKLPRPEDDFLYDLKKAAMPFTVSMEGIWAEECGIPVRLAKSLKDYARFFASTERKRRLKDSKLPKTTFDELARALLAAIAGVESEHWRDCLRDIVKKIIIEWAEETAKTYKLIAECSLTGRFWSEVGLILGYAPKDGEATIDDLAFEMVASTCKSLLPDTTISVSSDAERILSDIASSSRKSNAYRALIEKVSSSIAEMIPQSLRTPDAIGGLATIPQFDQWVLFALADMLDAGTLRTEQMARTINARRATYWYPQFEDHYLALEAAADFFDHAARFNTDVAGVTGAKEIFERYCDAWFKIDQSYRFYFTHLNRLQNGKLKQKLGAATQRILSVYDQFLLALTDKWQMAIFNNDAGYPPASIASQNNFFDKKVRHELPAAQEERRVGVIISDALRFEVGAELANRLARSHDKQLREQKSISCRGLLCMLPSYTQLGMAALLPGHTLAIEAATGLVTKDGKRTDGLTHRAKMLDEALPGSIALKAEALFNKSTTAILTDTPVVYVYHNIIDKAGDDKDNESKVFEACENACSEIERLASELIAAGCGIVYITADHGFLYQAGDRESYNYAEVENLSLLTKVESMDFNYTRRFIVADEIPQSNMLFEYDAIDLSLEGDAKIAFPRGITRLRLRGSGASYVHGGASLQEDVIPLVTIKKDASMKKARQTEVQCFMTGRPSIAGSTVAIDVYQTEPCSQLVLPITVKIGLYAPDGAPDADRLLSAREKTIVLDSESTSSEERKTRVVLDVTNDVDNYGEAVLRISKQIGSTKKYRSVWEQTYQINRGFGNDFDF